MTCALSPFFSCSADRVCIDRRPVAALPGTLVKLYVLSCNATNHKRRTAGLHRPHLRASAHSHLRLSVVLNNSRLRLERQLDRTCCACVQPGKDQAHLYPSHLPTHSRQLQLTSLQTWRSHFAALPAVCYSCVVSLASSNLAATSRRKQNTTKTAVILPCCTRHCLQRPP